MTTTPKKPNTLRRRSTHIWGDQGHNGSTSTNGGMTIAAPPLSQPTLSYCSEVEVEKSLMAGNLYNSSSSIASSSTSSPHKPIAANNMSRRISIQDIQMADGTKSVPKRGKTSGKSPRSKPMDQNDSVQSFIESSQSQSQPQSQDSRRLRRTLSNISNASTILIDPDYEQCTEKLDKQGIKHHDYAFSPPSPLPLRQTPEMFDPYEGIAEFEYKLHQNPRNNAVPGKITRRLLDCGWITMDEVHERCNSADMEELRRWDQEGGYPHFLRFAGEQHPPISKKQRLWVMMQKRRLYQRVDKWMDDLRQQEEYRVAYVKEQEGTKSIQEQWVEEQQKRTAKAQSKLKEPPSPGRSRGKEDGKGKRRFEGEAGGAEVEKGLGSPKRVCFSTPPSPSNTEPSSQSQGREPRPKKVWSDSYWYDLECRLGLRNSDESDKLLAPRSAYDTEEYSEPEVVVIQSQHAERSDTPPLEDGFSQSQSQSQSQSSQSQSQSQSQSRPRKPVPLVHPKKTKGLQRGGLSRQQTLVAF